VAVSDSRGAIYLEQGLDIPSLLQYKQESRDLREVYCSGPLCHVVTHEVISNEALLNLDVDVLVPAALENQITVDNAAQVQARFIFEVANGPITSGADAILAERGIYVFPDILVNAGGVTVSYFEWVQNRSGLYWEAAEVERRLRERMVRETEKIWAIARREEIAVRTAAYVHALGRLSAAIQAKGTRDYYVTPSPH
jgi:glutamate dehydrogenase (NADP+)